MKLLTYSQPKVSQKKHVGLLWNEHVLNLSELFKFDDMIDLIEAHEALMPKIDQVIKQLKTGAPEGYQTAPLDQIQIEAPIPQPISMRDGYAFRQHVETARKNRGVPMIPEFDQFPIFYFTNHNAVTGPGPVQVMDRHLERLDFELEVGFIVGKEGRNIKAADADEYIFGYTIMNDWSARGMQMEEMKLNLGPAKGKDFATSIGPYLVPRAALGKLSSKDKDGERHNLKMKAFVNGKQVSEGNMKDISWTCAQILERISYGVDIYPGEVIGTGTVGTGCFLELNGSKITDNQWLGDGDKVVLEVDELGKLENTIQLVK